jgi:hypothetical protein
MESIPMVGGKDVLINEALPDGVLLVNDTQIMLSRRGWEALLRQIHITEDVRRIVEDRMGDVLAWLRAAGHAV